MGFSDSRTISLKNLIVPCSVFVSTNIETLFTGLKNLIVALDLTTNLQPTETHRKPIRCHDQSPRCLRRNRHKTRHSPSCLLIARGVVLAGGTSGSVLSAGDSRVTTAICVATVKSESSPTLTGGDYTILLSVKTSERSKSTNHIRGRRPSSLQSRKSLCPRCSLI